MSSQGHRPRGVRDIGDGVSFTIGSVEGTGVRWPAASRRYGNGFRIVERVGVVSPIRDTQGPAGRKSGGNGGSWGKSISLTETRMLERFVAILGEMGEVF